MRGGGEDLRTEKVMGTGIGRDCGIYQFDCRQNDVLSITQYGSLWGEPFSEFLGDSLRSGTLLSFGSRQLILAVLLLA